MVCSALREVLRWCIRLISHQSNSRINGIAHYIFFTTRTTFPMADIFWNIVDNAFVKQHLKHMDVNLKPTMAMKPWLWRLSVQVVKFQLENYENCCCRESGRPMTDLFIVSVLVNQIPIQFCSQSENINGYCFLSWGILREGAAYLRTVLPKWILWVNNECPDSKYNFKTTS